MRFVLLSVLALAVGLTACGEQKTFVASKTVTNGEVVSAGSMEVTAPAFRAALGNNANTAAYATLTNTGSEDDRLVSAACDCAQTVEIHTMRHDNGMMKMEALPDGLVIKAGESVQLAPGGNHIMLMGLTQRPELGTMQSLTLTFEKAGSVTVNFPVVQQVASPAHH